jgi:hypothetical protein
MKIDGRVGQGRRRCLFRRETGKGEKGCCKYYKRYSEILTVGSRRAPATISLGGAWCFCANLGGKVPPVTVRLEQSSQGFTIVRLLSQFGALPPLRGRGRCGRASSDFVVSGGRSGRI